MDTEAMHIVVSNVAYTWKLPVLVFIFVWLSSPDDVLDLDVSLKFSA